MSAGGASRGGTPGIGRYLADYERFARNGAASAPAWLRELRERGIGRFAELGFPTTRLEDWKYTNVLPALEPEFARGVAPAAPLTRAAIAPYSLGDACAAELVFVNGRFAAELSSIAGLPDGVCAGNLAAALGSDAARLSDHLGRLAKPDEHAFVALNTAFLDDGAVIVAGAGAVAEKPIHVLSIASAAAPVAAYLRHLVVAGERSQLAVVETYASLGEGKSFTSSVTEIVAAQAAVVTHGKLEAEDAGSLHVAAIEAALQRDAAFTSHELSLGGGLLRNDLHVLLDGEGADATLNGLFATVDGRHVDNHTQVDHARPHTASRELYKGVLAGRSRGVFNGKILVHRDAQHTDARQTNKNLLLSPDATINTKPQLEIHADDVKCSHGSTIGQVDPDALFYVRTRGIDLAEARNLLTHAFASEMIGRIELPALRELTRHRLAATLGSRLIGEAA